MSLLSRLKRWLGVEDPLPGPSRPFDLGYMFEDGRYGDFFAEVKDRTNLYHAWAFRGYALTNEGPDVWIPRMKFAVKRAVRAGKRIVLNLDLTGAQAPVPWRRVIRQLASSWDSVVRIELADEPPWGPPELRAQIQEINAFLDQLGLARKPLTVIYFKESVQTPQRTKKLWALLDIVTFEALIDAPGGSAEENEVNLNRLLDRAYALAPAGKPIVLVAQAYSRNFAWKNIETLAALQPATYRAALRDPRVIGLELFAWGRPSGSREYPALAREHQRIWDAITPTR